MKETLEYFHADLKLQIAVICKHLRDKSYPKNSQVLQGAITGLAYYSVLADELEMQLGHLKQITEALKGGIIEEKDDIYLYCLSFFEVTDLPLGAATDELKNWIGTLPDREQLLYNGLTADFPNIDFLFVDEDGSNPRPASESDKFRAQAYSLLQNIEDSNVLDEFNQQMQRVRLLLKQKEPISQILKVLSETA